MKAILLMPLFTLWLYAPGLTGSSKEQIEIREDFNSISIKGLIKVILVPGESGKTIRYKNGKIDAEVHNGELLIKQKNSFLTSEEPLVIIPVRYLESIKVLDNAAVFSQGVICTDTLRIDHRGDGILKLSVSAKEVYICSHARGKIQMEGTFKQLLSSTDDAGNILLEYRN